MAQIVLIGIGAGAAAALLFASTASGAPLSLLLACLASLPILIAALGWSHWAALVATLMGAVSLSVVLDPSAFLAFLIRVGLPAWWIGYLALLARPAPPPATDQLEWYPVGHLVTWTALLSAAVVVALLLSFGFDGDSIRSGLGQAIEQALRQLTSTSDQAMQNRLRRFVDIIVLILPPGLAVTLTLINLLNLWLAGLVVKLSGRLRRPPSDLAAMQFPSYAPLLLAAAVAASFLPGLIGLGGGVLSASFFMAYAVLGFAVMHAITRNMGSRPFILGGLYAAVIVLGWPVLAATVLGLADTALDIRGRVARRRGPPSART